MVRRHGAHERHREQQSDDGWTGEHRQRGERHVAGNLDDTDPKFANPVGFDFHVQSGSAAIGAGLRLAIVPDDVDGLRRATAGGYTVGAYQYP